MFAWLGSLLFELYYLVCVVGWFVCLTTLFYVSRASPTMTGTKGAPSYEEMPSIRATQVKQEVKQEELSPTSRTAPKRRLQPVQAVQKVTQPFIGIPLLLSASSWFVRLIGVVVVIVIVLVIAAVCCYCYCCHCC